MTALLMTIYLIGALGMGGFVLLAAAVGAMLGSIPNSAYIYAIVAAALWPLCILWGAGNVVYQKVRN